MKYPSLHSPFFSTVVKLSCLVLCSMMITGCGIIAPVVDSVQRAGITESGRQQALQLRLKDFHLALYWGKPNEAVAYIKDENRKALTQEIVKQSRDERIVESKIEFVSYNDMATEAVVDVVSKFYKTPYYIVTERKETEKWDFSLLSGWRLVSREPTKVDEERY